MKKLKVSIIVVTYNEADHLEKTLDSISRQDYSDYECIIVDGGSSDRSIDVIKAYDEVFGERMHWISEPDKGIFDAINKGIGMSTGDIIGVQYDLYAYDRVISDIVAIVQSEKTDGVHGDLVYIDQGRVRRFWKTGKQKNITSGWLAAHPTLYLKREVYEKYGLYDINYKCASDYDFQIRIFKSQEVKVSYIPKVLIHMFYGGTSTGGIKNYLTSLMEGHKALKEQGMRWVWLIDMRRMYKVLQSFLVIEKKIIRKLLI